MQYKLLKGSVSLANSSSKTGAFSALLMTRSNLCLITERKTGEGRIFLTFLRTTGRGRGCWGGSVSHGVHVWLAKQWLVPSLPSACGNPRLEQEKNTKNPTRVTVTRTRCAALHPEKPTPPPKQASPPPGPPPARKHKGHSGTHRSASPHFPL